MQPLVLTALAAITISAMAVVWSVWSWRRVEWRIRAHENLKLMMAVEAKLADLPSALRFHGINELEIKDVGLSIQEFMYLVQNFSAGQAFYEFDTRSASVPFIGDDYRAIICAQKDVRAAWKFIRPFMDATPYRDKLDKTFAELASATSEA